MINIKWPKYSCRLICNVEAYIIAWIIDLSIRTKMNIATRQEIKNAAQDDIQHSATPRRRNHKGEIILIYVKIIYLDWNRVKDEDGWFRIKNWPKTTPSM